MALTITKTNYNGEVVEKIFTNVMTSNQLVEKGLIRIYAGVQDRISIPKLKLSEDIIQKRVKSVNSSNSKGDFTWSETELVPADMMVYVEFDPSLYEHVWRQYQPKGNLVFATLPADVQMTMLEQVTGRCKSQMGRLFINGVKGNDPEQLMDGILTKMAADSNVLVVNPAGITSVTDKLKALRSRIPEELREASNLRILMSISDWDDYDDELTAQPNKNVASTDINKPYYKNIKIETLAGWPKGVIVATLASMDDESNLFAAVNLIDDSDVVQVDKVSAASEMYFFKMLFKADTGIGFGEECIVIDSRTTPAFTPNVEPINNAPAGGDEPVGDLSGEPAKASVDNSGQGAVAEPTSASDEGDGYGFEVTSENSAQVKAALATIDAPVAQNAQVSFVQTVIDTLTQEQFDAFEVAFNNATA